MLIEIFSPLNMQQHQSQKDMHLHQMINVQKCELAVSLRIPINISPLWSWKKLGCGKEKGIKGWPPWREISILISYSLMWCWITAPEFGLPSSLPQGQRWLWVLETKPCSLQVGSSPEEEKKQLAKPFPLYFRDRESQGLGRDWKCYIN